MAITAEQADWLLTEARALRPRALGSTRTAMKIAADLGIEVWLRGSPAAQTKDNGHLEYTSPPRVTVSRRSDRPFTRRITVADETLLGSRGRFTLAHELGHWLVYQRFGINPATRRSDYWKDEEAVNRFAARILIPDWQLDEWFSELDTDQGIHVHLITKWARESGLSREVTAARVSEHRKGTGFLALTAKVRLGVHFPDLLVTHSAFDASLALPLRPSIIRSERLTTKLSRSSTDSDMLRDFSFDERRRIIRDYYISWVALERGAQDKAASPATETAYWTSWSSRSFNRICQDEVLPHLGIQN